MVYKYALDDTRMPELRNAHKKVLLSGKMHLGT